jgi:hypothetical protein
MITVTNRDAYTSHLLNTINFDIWTTLALNTGIMNPHQDLSYVQAFMYMQSSNPALFRQVLKYCHARFGPSLPKEIIAQLMTYLATYNFMETYESKYPDKLYVRSGMKYVEIHCKTAFKFATLRKLLFKAWEITPDGPQINPEET